MVQQAGNDWLREALSHYQAGRLDKARAVYLAMLEQQPHQVEAMLLLGIIAYRTKEYDRSLGYFQQVISIKQDWPETYNNLGACFWEQGKIEQAIAAYKQAIALKPDYPKAYNNWGNCLKTLGRLDEAIAQYQRAIALDPQYAGAYNRLGNTLKKQGKIAEAIAQYHLALAIEPNYVEVHNNMALVLQTEGRLEEAIGYYNKSLELRPNDASTHFARAFTWLLKGDLPSGWHEYEWRWDDDIVAPRHFAEPLWDGSYLEGGTIFIYTEQGLGDNIQFIRYAPLVKERVGRVIVECPECLVRLFATVPGIDRVVSQDTVPEKSPLPEFDVQVPLMSLPRIVCTTLENIPASIPYLRPLISFSDRRQQDPSQPPKMRVGLLTPPLLRGAGGDRLDEAAIKVEFVWASTDSYLHDLTRYRSCSLDLFLELLDIPTVPEKSVALYSLQKEPSSEALKRLLQTSERIVSLHKQLGDFADTANAIAQLDLVISVDTAVAHLAGAMGKPVWVLLPFAPDWRWMLDRSDSPWYPTMRLFRQSQPGDWQGVFVQIKSALQSLVPNNQQLAIALDMHQAGRLEAAEDYFNLGVTLQQHGQPEQAHAQYELALQLRPDYADAYHNIGVALLQTGKPEQAIGYFQGALNIKPDYIDAYNNMGHAMYELRRTDEAIAAYSKTLEIDRSNVEAHFARSLALLYANNFTAGFAEYHWRWHLPGNVVPAFPQPLWKEEELTGLTILLHAEQGLGDTIQFIRYVPLVAQRHPRTIVCACGPSLVRLFSTIPGISKLVSVVDQSVEFDVHAPLMGLPGILGTTVQTIPAQIPYLHLVPDNPHQLTINRQPLTSELFGPQVNGAKKDFRVLNVSVLAD